MKVYESHTLLSAMEERSKQYNEFKEQLINLKEAFNGVADLGDDFHGKGADNIKSFYQEQAGIVDQWLNLVNSQMAFLDSIPGLLEDANLSGDTFIDERFLENPVSNGLKNAKVMVSEQKSELKKIFADIHDIISLEPFSSEIFHRHINDAEDEQKETVEKVHDLDQKLKNEYAKSEKNQDSVNALSKALMNATRQGKNTSPLYFNIHAYQNSEAYKQKAEIDAKTKEYLIHKEEKAEKRRIEKLKIELENPANLTIDEYLKKADEIGFDNLTLSQQQYVIQLQSSKQNWEMTKGIGVGLYDVGKDTVTGLIDLAKGAWEFSNLSKPEQGLAITNAIINTPEQVKAIAAAISDSYERDMVNGDTYSRAHWVTYALGTVVTSVVGTKGAGAVTKSGALVAKTGAAAAKTAATKGVTKIKSAVDQLTIYDFMPYAPQHRLATADGVAFNVVDGVGLRDNLISQAKIILDPSRKPFTGKNVTVPWLNKNKYDPVEVEGKVKSGGNVKDVSRRVYTLKDIDINQKDKRGFTNLELMKKGDAPYAKDGTKINLHHLIQEEPGPMVEIPESLHTKYSRVLHGLKEDGESFRNDKELSRQYDSFRRRYWKWRGKQFENQD
ncbi:T7SS effector LXG polymorphic toxin [Metabacillus arenae]|uniref:Ribonuclease YeeF family protein n=1 Tax=Metabacillus arenae TaxID=2771434 RepID=A0A926NI96_9BACI|nr:T7SS effector LXG polymorphic toxin [Metabacillus arenae]MBD1381550.1 ribonuclease YeeF family protein [Metabacillus arenae]